MSRIPASVAVGASNILVAMRSGKFQLSGNARAKAPGRKDHTKAPASAPAIAVRTTFAR
jgi:hypothetical protein